MSKRKIKTTQQVRCAIYTRKSSEEGRGDRTATDDGTINHN